MLLLILAAALAFSPALAGGFYLDDLSLLDDPAFTTPGGLTDLAGRVRPLTNLTLWANFQLHGDAPFGFHLVNLLLHLAAIAFAYDALTRLLPGPAALLAATVFALHPLQTEPVAYVFARSSVLCGLCSWAAISAWVRERPWLAVVATGLALAAKEEAVALPLFFTLLAWMQRRLLAGPLAAMWALALATGVRGLLATARIAGSGAGFDVARSPWDYALAQGQVIGRYCRLLVLPIGLNFDPDLAIVPWLAALAWALLLAGLVLAWRKVPKSAFWWTAGLLFLAPTSTLLPIDDLAADRRMYLAGACFAAGVGLLAHLTRPQIAALGAVLALMTASRSQVFASADSLWRDTVAGSPDKLRPRIQMARVLPPEAALQLLGNDPRATSERGRIYLELQRPADALREFGAALAERPGDPGALTNRGTALALLGQLQPARQDFARALAQQPCFYPALLNLSRVGAPLPDLSACRLSPRQLTELRVR